MTAHVLCPLKSPEVSEALSARLWRWEWAVHSHHLSFLGLLHGLVCQCTIESLRFSLIHCQCPLHRGKEPLITMSPQVVVLQLVAFPCWTAQQTMKQVLSFHHVHAPQECLSVIPAPDHTAVGVWSETNPFHSGATMLIDLLFVCQFAHTV